jgi:hypothetical protein
MERDEVANKAHVNEASLNFESVARVVVLWKEGTG